MTTNPKTTNHTDGADDNWMIEAAAEAAPPLTADTIDQLRRYLAPARTATPVRTGLPQEKAA